MKKLKGSTNIGYALHISGCFATIMRRKTNYIIISKDFFDLSLHIINQCSSIWFLSVNIKPNSTFTFPCSIYNYSGSVPVHLCKFLTFNTKRGNI